MARAWLAHALVAMGDLDEAEREATISLEASAMLPAAQSVALAALAFVHLGRGRPRDALAFIGRAPDDGWLSNGSMLRLVRAEALHALGREHDAHAAIREARDRILRVAATLDDPELCHSYVTHFQANARTLRLAREWLGEGSP